MRILGRCLFAALLLTLSVAAPAQATFPGDNGRISFHRFTGTEESPQQAIFTIRPAGFGARRVTNFGDPNEYSGYPDWSPDGERLAFEADPSGSGPPQIWTSDPDGSRARQLTGLSGAAVDPAWAPDGRTLVIARAFEEPEEPSGIYVIPARPRHGTLVTDAQARLVTPATDGGFDSEAQFSPDGKWIAFTRISAACFTGPPESEGCTTRVFRVRSDGRKPPQELTAAARDASAPDFHPSGRWIAYDTHDNFVAPNAGNIEVMRPDGSDKRVLIRGDNDDFFNNPSFSPDGRQMTFARWAADVEGAFPRIWVARADGGGRRALAGSVDDNKPDWGSRGRGHHGW
jgi:TolB protein